MEEDLFKEEDEFYCSICGKHLETEDEVNVILNGVENLGLVKRDFNGWILTSEGGRTCDDYLNRNLENIDF